MSEETRLDRIETKLDKVGEAIVDLARMEERLITLFKRMDRYDDEQSRASERIDTLESKAQRTGLTVAVVERVFWIAVTAVLAMYIRTNM